MAFSCWLEWIAAVVVGRELSLMEQLRHEKLLTLSHSRELVTVQPRDGYQS